MTPQSMDTTTDRCGPARPVGSRALRASARGSGWVHRCVPLYICALLLLCSDCGSEADPQSENYGNLLASPGGLIVLQQEHPTGWMRSDCFGCHFVDNMHQINRTGLPDDEVDLPGIRAIIANQGESSCVMCHGTNGVPQ